MAKKEKHRKDMENIEETQIEAEDSQADCPVSSDEAVSVKEQLAQMEKQAADNLDKYQRTLAEFDNFRKRTAKEKTSMHDDGVRDTIEKLLPVIDNFERAILASANTEDSFYKGIIMILKQLKSFLDDLGVEVIEAVGETFDHNQHYAVAHVDDDNYGEGEVIEEMQKGYKYKDKIIRCSMVKVAN